VYNKKICLSNLNLENVERYIRINLERWFTNLGTAETNRLGKRRFTVAKKPKVVLRKSQGVSRDADVATELKSLVLVRKSRVPSVEDADLANDQEQKKKPEHEKAHQKNVD